MSENYTNVATSDHRALIVYLLDVSGSMAKPMQKTGKTRIEAVEEAFYATIQEMVARSSKQGIIRPRYEVAVFAYSDDVFDVYGGVRKIDYISDKGVPQLHPQNRTDMVLAFKTVRDLLAHEINSWTDEEKQYRPAPLVVHMTDAENTERLGNPLPFVKEIMKMEVPDGKVLIENIFITEDIKIPTSDIKAFNGFMHEEILDNPFGERLLIMSSLLPEPYREPINNTLSTNIQQGTAMMFPGITPEYVRIAFALSGMSGIALPNAHKTRTDRDWESD